MLQVYKVIVIIYLTLLSSVAHSEELVTAELINNITHLYQGPAKNRLLTWANLVQTKPGASEIEKLQIVNAYFNKLTYRSDQSQFNRVDFWMTPVEFITRGAGDCEDYAIGKYFTLQAIGIPQSKLRITYVIYRVQNIAHMVLTYYPTPDAMPLVLDNLTPNILSADKRSDLKPVYSFNGDGLWQSVQRNQGRRISGSGNISMWRDLNTRMNKQLQGMKA